MELITPEQLNPILKKMGSKAVQLQKDHINTQTNIDGTKFAPLKPSTIAAKQRSSRGGVQGNAEKRMKATNDFVQNAFKYEVNGDGSVTVFVSNLPHKQDKTYNARRAYETREKHGKTNHKDKASYVNNQGQVITQEDIGGWQLCGEHNTGKRSPHNVGANFFGLSNSDEQKLETIFAKVVPIIDRNIEYAIIDGLK
jgi:hypothetical protein